MELDAAPADADGSEDIEYKRITLTLAPRRGPRRAILDGVSGTALAGRMTALMGPSGSGKTSLINAVAGSLRRSSVPCELSGVVLVGVVVLCLLIGVGVG